MVIICVSPSEVCLLYVFPLCGCTIVEDDRNFQGYPRLGHPLIALSCSLEVAAGHRGLIVERPPPRQKYQTEQDGQAGAGKVCTCLGFTAYACSSSAAEPMTFLSPLASW